MQPAYTSKASPFPHPNPSSLHATPAPTIPYRSLSSRQHCMISFLFVLHAGKGTAAAEEAADDKF